jgi:hypothetical protein
MTSRYVTMLLVIAGFALAPASVQASDDDDRPGVAISPGPGYYESATSSTAPGANATTIAANATTMAVP